MKKKDLKPGDRVTCKTSVAADYSGYAGEPRVYFAPGMVGIVRSVDVPCVTNQASFVSVRFELLGRTWKVGLRYSNVRKLPSTKE